MSDSNYVYYHGLAESIRMCLITEYKDRDIDIVITDFNSSEGTKTSYGSSAKYVAIGRKITYYFDGCDIHLSLINYAHVTYRKKGPPSYHIHIYYDTPAVEFQGLITELNLTQLSTFIKLMLCYNKFVDPRYKFSDEIISAITSAITNAKALSLTKLPSVLSFAATKPRDHRDDTFDEDKDIDMFANKYITYLTKSTYLSRNIL